MLYPGSGPSAYTKKNGNDNLATRDDDMAKNIIEEVNAIEWVPNSASYRMEKLNLDVLREEQCKTHFALKMWKPWE